MSATVVVLLVEEKRAHGEQAATNREVGCLRKRDTRLAALAYRQSPEQRNPSSTPSFLPPLPPCFTSRQCSHRYGKRAQRLGYAFNPFLRVPSTNVTPKAVSAGQKRFLSIHEYQSVQLLNSVSAFELP